jgi:hypothetical protein
MIHGTELPAPFVGEDSASGCTTPPAKKIEEQHHHRHDQQDVYQASSHMKAEAKKPANQQNYKDCPKHIASKAR